MIEWMVTSSVLIVLVVLLRRLVGERISPRLRYALWGLVLLRLVIPVTLWDSGFSVLGAVRAVDSYQIASTLPDRLELYEDGTVRTMTGTTQEVFRWDGPAEAGETYPETFHNAYGWAAVPSPEEAQALREEGEKAVDTGQLKRLVDLRGGLLKLWQAGMWIGDTFLVAVNLRFYLGLRRRRQRAGSYRGRPVYTAAGLPSPCLFGLLRPAIYLTPALEGEAREHVLAHEYAHFRQGDHAWAIWRGVCLAIHWYNPLVWLAAALSRRDCELACDERAVRLLGEDRRAAYGRTLVGLVAGRTGPADLLRCATTMTGGKSAVKERIALLIKRPRTTVPMACAVAAACAVFALCTFTGAAAKPENPDPARPVNTEQEEPAPQPPEEPEGPDVLPETSEVLPETQDALPEGAILLPLPADLPTEPMDLTRPAADQGEWLLLAQAPLTDAALYRRADDDQRVYLRLGQACFQEFDRDLSGMELLPTIELWDEAELALEVLYPRYEGTYFNGTSYEPGIVADMVLYTWNGICWEEGYISTQIPQLLTEDLPALADLPLRMVAPGTAEQERDIWLVGELPDYGIAAYCASKTGESWLRYGTVIQEVEESLVATPQMFLPELYFEDLDGDGDRELAVISCQGTGTGISRWQLTVYEWDGERWTGTTHRPMGRAEDFNRERVFQFYDDGTAYISYDGSTLLLDLSFYSTFLEQPPRECILGDPEWLTQVHYTYRDGQLWLTMTGQILNGQTSRLSGYLFDYVCPLVYADYDRDGSVGYLSARQGLLRSDYAVQPAPPRLSGVHRDILAAALGACDGSYPNAFAVHDVDGDGAAELLVRWMPAGAIASAWGTAVYDSAGRETFHGYGELTFYSGGDSCFISEPWSHNQGQACAIWPYRLHRYSAGAPFSQELGSVRAMDSAMERFPAEADLDGDGMVYFIMEDALTEENAVDNDMYQAWRDQYLAGAKAVPIQYFPLTAESLEALA